ncbi:hypothetical protein DAA48_21800 [Aeromonas veronii]|uniref:Uncharacterized protein n=1 Tax=Aeromonas veronii TaxID=654 RepID=A0A2T4MWY6_AERVE|nr:hypothetical protein DAA48_21800 [Aeromonas veronii]
MQGLVQLADLAGEVSEVFNQGPDHIHQLVGILIDRLEAVGVTVFPCLINDVLADIAWEVVNTKLYCQIALEGILTVVTPLAMLASSQTVLCFTIIDTGGKAVLNKSTVHRLNTSRFLERRDYFMPFKFFKGGKISNKCVQRKLSNNRAYSPKLNFLKVRFGGGLFIVHVFLEIHFVFLSLFE